MRGTSAVTISFSFTKMKYYLCMLCLTRNSLLQGQVTRLFLQIVDETEMAEYNQRLIDWTNMKEEKQYTFTITEDDLKRPQSGPHLKSISHPSRAMSHSEGDLRKYQALPPIGSPRETKRKKTSRSSRQETPPQPVPPESFLLHLGITARTHAIGEFYGSFPAAVNKFLIDQ